MNDWKFRKLMTEKPSRLQDFVRKLRREGGNISPTVEALAVAGSKRHRGKSKLLERLSRRRERWSIVEDCDCSSATLVGTGDEPVLRRVKVLGGSSLNRRRYTPEAVQQALGLYEGVRVNIDHPDRPTNSRSLRDRFGRLVGCVCEGGEMFADLKYNPAHPMASAVRWFAEHDSQMLGLSHNAVGEGESRDGIFVVEKIVSVRSVDLVADPATVAGLFE